MTRTNNRCLLVLLGGLALASTCAAADEPKTADKRDTLLYVRTVPPGAKVRLDGKELGKSDGLFPVAAGDATIVVELEGHERSSAHVTIRANGITRITLTLKPDKTTPDDKPAVLSRGDALQLSQQGWLLWRQGQSEKAVAKFKAAVKLAPRNENAWNGLGWASLNTGNSDEAQKAFEKVVSLNPRHPAALNGLGQLYLGQKKYDLAEKYLLKAAPQAPAAWFGLTRLYLLQGNFEQAENFAQRIEDSGQADDIARRMLKAAKERQLSEGLRVVIEPQAPAANETTMPELKETPPTAPQAEARDDTGRATTDDQNILKNSGFETGDKMPDHWAKGAIPEGVAAVKGVTYSWDKKVAFEGKASMRIEKTAQRYYPIATWSQTVERQGDQPALLVSAQVKAKNMTKAVLDVMFIDQYGQSTHQWAAYIGSKEDGDPPANHDWKQYAGEVNIPPQTKKLCIGLQVYGPGKVWFDNVQARYGK